MNEGVHPSRYSSSVGLHYYAASGWSSPRTFCTCHY